MYIQVYIILNVKPLICSVNDVQRRPYMLEYYNAYKGVFNF